MSTLPGSPCVNPPPNIGAIAGPLLLGHLLHWTLLGALSVQVYTYYLAFPLDPLKWKALVYIIYMVELVQAILMSTEAFKTFASGFGNFQTLDDHGLLWFATPVLSAIVATVVQIFYAFRIKTLAGSIFIPVLIALTSLAQLGGGIALGALSRQSPFSKLLNPSTLIAADFWNAGSALCDVIIAVSMTYYLSRTKPEWKITQRRIQRVTRLTLETGALTAAVAVLNLALYQIPHTLYFETTSGILGKMYSNTMMVVLNSRILFNSQNDTTSWNDHPSGSHKEIHRGPGFSTEHGSITVTHERWSDSLPSDGYKLSLLGVPDNVRAASTK